MREAAGRHRRPRHRAQVPVARRWTVAGTVLLLAALAGVLGPAHAAFVGTTTNGVNTITASATFPTYPNEVTGNAPWAYYRGEESASSASTSTASDSSGNSRSGTYPGTTDGPATWWPFDENTGTVARDSSGAANTGTLVSTPTWTTGVSGSALSFNGSSQYVNGARSAVATNRSYTVAAWVYLTTKATNRTAIGQDSTTLSAFFLQWQSGPDRWAFVTYSADTGGTGYAVYGTSSPALNTWYHLVGVYDSVAQQDRLYVNGVLQGTTSATGSFNATGVFTVGRGKWAGVNADPWAGTIDDVRAYQRALSASEIADLAGYSIRTKWDFSEGSGGTTADASPYNNTGTLTSTGWTASGKSGNGLTFNGSSSVVTGPSGLLSTSTSFSVAAWVYMTSKTTFHTAVSQDAGTMSGFYLQYDFGADRWSMTMRGSDSTSSAVAQATSTTSPAVNTWYHLVGVYDSAAQTIALYVNGSLQNTSSFTTPWSATGAFVVGRGRYSAGPVDWWAGTIDSVRAYQQALTAADVTSLYNGTDPSYTESAMSAGILGALQGAQQGLQSTTAIAFAGSSGSYAYTNTSQAAPAAFTEECWFRTASTTGGVIIGFGNTQTGNPTLFDRILYLDSGNRLTFGTWPSTTALTVRSAATYNDGAWHHVAASIGAAGARLYVDGVRVVSDVTITTSAGFAGYWRWGGDALTGWPNYPSTGYLTGTIDEVAFYNTQLSDQQIAWHYDANH